MCNGMQPWRLPSNVHGHHANRMRGEEEKLLGSCVQGIRYVLEYKVEPRSVPGSCYTYMAKVYVPMIAQDLCIVCHDGPCHWESTMCLECIMACVRFLCTAPSAEVLRVWRELRDWRTPVLDEPGSSETHADLAAAYLDMGLLTDALKEATQALADSSRGEETERVAVTVVVDTKIGGPEIARRLDAALKHWSRL